MTHNPLSLSLENTLNPPTWQAFLYINHSAFSEGLENSKGTLSPGMLADLAVLSQDIFTVPTQDLPKTVSELTIIDGKIVHDDAVNSEINTNGY